MTKRQGNPQMAIPGRLLRLPIAVLILRLLCYGGVGAGIYFCFSASDNHPNYLTIGIALLGGAISAGIASVILHRILFKRKLARYLESKNAEQAMKQATKVEVDARAAAEEDAAARILAEVEESEKGGKRALPE
jgi:hypothetical protein